MITTNNRIVFSRIEFYLTCILFVSNTLAATIVQNQQHQISILKDELERQAETTQKIADTLHELHQKQHTDVSPESVSSVQHLVDVTNSFHLNPKYVLGIIGTFFIWYTGKRIYSKISKATLLALVSKMKIFGIPLFTQMNTLKFLKGDYIFSVDIDEHNTVHQLKGKHLDDVASVDIVELLSRDIAKEHELAVEMMASDITTTAQGVEAIGNAFSALGG